MACHIAGLAPGSDDLETIGRYSLYFSASSGATVGVGVGVGVSVGVGVGVGVDVAVAVAVGVAVSVGVKLGPGCGTALTSVEGWCRLLAVSRLRRT